MAGFEQINEQATMMNSNEKVRTYVSRYIKLYLQIIPLEQICHFAQIYVFNK